jgi:hypothetical protein
MGPVSALQGALAAEHAACYGYPVAGAHLAGGRQAAAEQDWTSHSKARDALAAMISSLGAAPVAAQAFYRLPFRVHDASTAMALAAHLEDGVTRAYLGLVAVEDQRLRNFGALAMQGSAKRAVFWRGSTQAFPGLVTPLAVTAPITRRPLYFTERDGNEGSVPDQSRLASHRHHQY